MSGSRQTPRVDQMIDRQVKEWDIRRKLSEPGGEAVRGVLAQLAEGPWVSFSKQLGADATTIARALRDQLGWQIYDKEIVEAIAKETHVRERILSRLDEHAIGRFNDLLTQLLVPDHPGQITYLLEMGRVIWALARQGHVILLGRGANWFLDSHYGLRVRAIAPTELRIRRIAEREKIGLKEAERKVRAADASRAAFIRQVYHRDIDDPLGYDLVVNTGTLDPAAAAAAVFAALKQKLG